LFNNDIELIAQRAAIQEKGIGQPIAGNSERIHSRGALVNRKGDGGNCFARTKPRRTVNRMLYPIANSLDFAT
jgi:hypothetical protein